MSEPRKRMVRKTRAKTETEKEERKMAELEKLLSKDLKSASEAMTKGEARYLVDLYYQIQEFRKASANQIRSLGTEEPGAVIGGVFESMEGLENRIKKGLDYYTDAQPLAAWAKNTIIGIGPVISAGLLAHIDITKVKTVGGIWRYAGLDPTVIWESKEKTDAWVKAQESMEFDALVVMAAKRFGRSLASLSKKPKTGEPIKSKADLVTALTRRPWNASLKVLLWKASESFVKVSGNPKSFYGKIYHERKLWEIAKNDSGENAETAKQSLEKKNYGKATEAYKAYAQGKLPDARVHLRATRWTVKIFLFFWFAEGYYRLHGVEAPLPYVIDQLKHTDLIWPDNMSYVPKGVTPTIL